MNKQINIFQFLSTQRVDHVTCPIDILLQMVDQYALIVETAHFSSQMLLLSRSIEENRNGMDAIRISMKTLAIVSPSTSETLLTVHVKSDE